jgi:MFS family permease
LCGFAVGFDGYDLIVYGTVIPALLQYEAWGLTAPQLGVIGSYAIIGMLFGALLAGTVTDIIGRRKALLICVTWFSIFTALCGVAPSPELFGLFRFLAGIGLGGLIPVATALTLEYAPGHRRNITYAAMMASYNVGGLLAAGLAILLIPVFGWQIMFLIALVPLFIIVPLGLKYLPESISFLVAQDRRDEAETLSRRFGVPLQEVAKTVEKEEETAVHGGKLHGLKTIISRLYLLRSVAFWVASFFGLMLIYGLSTWLPGIMTTAGYSVGSALSFLVLFQGGAVIGNLVAGGLADRFGTKVIWHFPVERQHAAGPDLPVRRGCRRGGLRRDGARVLVHRPVLSCEQPRHGPGVGRRGREVGSDRRSYPRRNLGGGRTGGAVGFLHLRARRGDRGPDHLPAPEVPRSRGVAKGRVDVERRVRPARRGHVFRPLRGPLHVA